MLLSEQAPAKINLGLHILRQRADGYHDVETVLHRIDWADTITVEPAETLSMTCSDPSLPTDDRNLCLQAARRLQETCDVSLGATLHLEKQVPHGAGLGGGSSDAATTIRLLSRLWELDVRQDTLYDVAASIGADVPFFLEGVPAAYGTGRGDSLSPLTRRGKPYELPFSVLVVVPPVKISTPSAYAQVTPNEEERSHLPDIVRSDDLARWQSDLTNDFEDPIVEMHPSIDAARTWLWEEGAEYVSLSGSGGAVFGVFPSDHRAERALQRGRHREERMHLMHGSGERHPEES